MTGEFKDKAGEKLLDWYDLNCRTLPWRAAPGENADPYRVWLSEIMLQQTTVAAVKSYFEKFISRWPTVNALAAAPLDDILEAWAGLGYYARARNLHKCAGVLMQQFGGRFPRELSALRSLPGVGEYTAAAVRTIAFGLPATVVDANVERIIARMHAVTEPLPSARKAIKAHTEKLARSAQHRPGDFAQAMMDLGAAVCTPKSPACAVCPISDHCTVSRRQDAEAFPKKAPKKTKPVQRAVFFWLECEGQVLLTRRPNEGLLAGMPGLFTTDWDSRSSEYECWQDRSPFTAEWVLDPTVKRHTFTHFHLDFQVARATIPVRANIKDGYWQPIDKLSGLPSLFKKAIPQAEQT